ncbi:alpha/beta hydrolase family protein [Actinoplanes friuliensis]|uniref:alpha/beta hydrolase family protein n=1 Tax=Actinoplanes friuliensis TaxID=196914 RepID=UPI0005A20E37|nr:alpha/beta hydrolase [Actinoplanes friuliensis]
MRRRTLIVGLAATAGTGALAACSAETATAPTATPSSAVPILASTTASSLPPQDVSAPYTPPPGRAPGRAHAVGRQVLQFQREDRSLPTTVWYPAEGPVPATPEPADDAAPARGRFPLVLFSHGLTAQPGDYAAMLARWAQAGFVVAGPTYPRTSYGAADFYALDIVNQPADASFVIDSLLATTGPLRAIIDTDRIAAAGHSAGGITTAGLFSAHRDERLKAGMVLAGTDFQGAAFTGPPAAMLFVHGRKDNTVAYRAGHAVFAAVPWSRAMLTITDGGHVTGAADFEATTGTSTEFFRWALYGDAAAKARLPQAAATGEVATLESGL